MSFFSRSKSKGHYPHQNHGSDHYKRSHGTGGILGKILNGLMGSKGHSKSHSNHHSGHYSNHHHRKSLWS